MKELNMLWGLWKCGVFVFLHIYYLHWLSSLPLVWLLRSQSSQIWRISASILTNFLNSVKFCKWKVVEPINILPDVTTSFQSKVSPINLILFSFEPKGNHVWETEEAASNPSCSSKTQLYFQVVASPWICNGDQQSTQPRPHIRITALTIAFTVIWYIMSHWYLF